MLEEKLARLLQQIFLLLNHTALATRVIKTFWPSGIHKIIRIVRLHVEKGVRIIRPDAVAFVWKEPESP